MIVGRNLGLATVLVFLTLISNGASSAEGAGNWLFGIGTGLVRLNAMVMSDSTLPTAPA